MRIQEYAMHDKIRDEICHLVGYNSFGDEGFFRSKKNRANYVRFGHLVLFRLSCQCTLKPLHQWARHFMQGQIFKWLQFVSHRKYSYFTFESC